MDVRETAKKHWITTLLATITSIVALLGAFGGLSPSITPAFMSDIQGVLVEVSDLKSTRVTQQITDLTIMIGDLKKAQRESDDSNFLQSEIVKQEEILRQLYVKQDRLAIEAEGG